MSEDRHAKQHDPISSRLEKLAKLDTSPTDSGIGYGDFLKVKAEEEELKKPHVLSMPPPMTPRDLEDNRKKWAGSHQSPAAYSPQWMGPNMVVTGTVSRVEVRDGRPQWITIYFKESPDATFVVCSPYPDMFQETVGDLYRLVGKTLEVTGQIESPYCGRKLSQGSIRVLVSTQWQVQ